VVLRQANRFDAPGVRDSAFGPAEREVAMSIREPVVSIEQPELSAPGLDGRRAKVLQELLLLAVAALRVRTVVLTSCDPEGERIVAGVGLRHPFLVGARLPLARPWARHGHRPRRMMQVTHVWPPRAVEGQPRFPDQVAAAW